jgi:hypothetical protein
VGDIYYRRILKMATRYKNNCRYAYETHNAWNKEKKKNEAKWVYLGVADLATGEIVCVRD